MDPQSRSFLGAAASAIKVLCLLIIRIIKVADDGVSMADKAVSTAKERQHVEMDLAQAEYAIKLRNTAALRQVKAEEEIRQYVAADPERAKLMEAARAKIDAIIAKSQAKLEFVPED